MVVTSKQVAVALLLLPVFTYIVRNKKKHPLIVSKVQFVVKVTLLILSIIVSATVGILSSPFLYLAGKRACINYIVATTHCILCRGFSGIDVRVENWHHFTGEPVVIVANHQSSMDILLMSKVIPLYSAVMAKKAMKHYPFLGWFMRVANAIWIDRANTVNAKNVMADAANQMKRTGASCFIFPEGTRSRLSTADLLPFKKGAFHLAVQGQVPIVPVVYSAYKGVYDSRGMFFPGGRIIARILEPIPTVGKTSQDVDELTNLAYERMLATLKEISAITAGDGAGKEAKSEKSE